MSHWFYWYLTQCETEESLVNSSTVASRLPQVKDSKNELPSFYLFLTLLSHCVLTCAVTVTLWETDTNLIACCSTFTAVRFSPLLWQPFELMTPYFYHIPSTAVNSDLMTPKLHIVNAVRFYVLSMLLQAASIKVLLWFIHQWGEPVWKTRQQPCCKRDGVI